MAMKIHYNPQLKQLACQLRNNSTLSEVLLWKRLKSKQMKGYDFHRQKPIDEYIVDFFCPKLNLIIEVDGISHDDANKLNDDRKRQGKLETLGFHVLRFQCNDITKDIDTVLQSIKEWIERNETLITHP